MKIFIADDEEDVRMGIRLLLDWKAMGFDICGEGKNGVETLEEILYLRPDIVLIDIRMPKLSGMEVIRQAMEQGFAGKFIILSGYSDFSYAQQAIRYRVKFYLTKPIDEEELADVVEKTRQELLEERANKEKMVQYRSKARDTIIQDIIRGGIDGASLEIEELFLDASVYQVIIYTSYQRQEIQETWDFAEILRLVNHNHNALENVVLDGQNVILLKGDFAIKRFGNLLEHYQESPQKGSPLDMLFLAYGEPVYTLEDIPASYACARKLMSCRFFCERGRHVAGICDIQLEREEKIPMASIVDAYPQKLANYIQTGNRELVGTALKELARDMEATGEGEDAIKYHLADIMIEMKVLLSKVYMEKNLSMLNNVSMINEIEEKDYLFEIMDFFENQFEIYMRMIGEPTRKGVMDSILQYIQHNYHKNLKLGEIAELFGYNSSYLGQAFSKTTGFSFNSYVDKVRIDVAKRLLEDGDYKVYEVADMVGYGSVDYFHKKFKKYVGMSPKEYRRGD